MFCWFALLCRLYRGSLAQVPRAIIPDGVGVHIHFTTGHERDLDMIAAASVKIVRMEFDWDKVESGNGTYNWADYDELLRHLTHRGLRAMLTLGGSRS